MKNCFFVLVLFTVITFAGPATIASAGFLDALNNANQAVQRTTSTIENTKNTAERAGKVIPKAKKESTAAAKIPPPQSSGSLTDKDRAAIEKAKRAWVAAFKAADWDALVDQYADDAILFPPNEDLKTGRMNIRTNFATEEETSEEVFETVEINGADKIAYVQGKFSFLIKPSTGDIEAVRVSGKYLEIWQKQSDGTWLITHDIWNANP